MIAEEIKAKIKPGATVRVWQKISASGGKKSDKERLMKFEGLVLAKKHGAEKGGTFTVRATILGVGVEKIYPLHSPMIEKVDILSSPRKIHRAKLYYIRNLSRRQIRQKVNTAPQEKTAN